MLQYVRHTLQHVKDICYSMSKTYVIVCQSHMLQYVKDICYSMSKPYVTACQRHMLQYVKDMLQYTKANVTAC
jgi:hypothetical protein